MQTLNRSYRDLERQADNYANADLAWQSARRRRSRTRVVVLAAVALVVAVSAAGVLRLTTGTQVATPAGPDVATVAPQPSTPALPGTAVGPGSMIYSPCLSGCPTYLVTEDGRQFGLGEQTAPVAGNFTLSPDGRWLGRPAADGYELRDLRGTEVVRLGLPEGSEAETRISPWTWSADSQRLVVGAHRDGTVAQWSQFTLAAAATPTGSTLSEVGLDVPAGYEPVGVKSSGELVLMPDAAATDVSDRLDLRLGSTGRTLALTAPDDATFADADRGAWVKVLGDRIVALAYAGRSTTAVSYSLTGRVLDQAPLRETDAPLGVDGRGLVVLSVPESGGPDATLLRLTGAERTALATVPLESQVVIPGGTRG